MDDPLHDAPLGAIETAPDGKITADNERVGPLTEHEADRRADRLNRRLDRVQQIDSLIVTVLQRIIEKQGEYTRLSVRNERSDRSEPSDEQAGDETDMSRRHPPPR